MTAGNALSYANLTEGGDEKFHTSLGPGPRIKGFWPMVVKHRLRQRAKVITLWPPGCP